MKKQNVVLKVGIGLALGIGAMVFAPKTAMASTPCTPGGPESEQQCPPPSNGDPNVFVESYEFVRNECYDTDCDGSHETSYAQYYHSVTYKCELNGVTYWSAPCYWTTFLKGGPC